MKCLQCATRLSNKGKICSTCSSRNWRKNNPIRYAYNNLKGHAKARGKEFTLTFEQFKEFAVKADYIAKKGRQSYSYHIDRKDETKGYTIDNIQILTNGENVRKYKQWRDSYYNNSSFCVATIKPQDPKDYEDCPF